MRIKKLTLTLLATCFVLSACNKYVAEADRRIETTLARVEETKEMAEIPDLPKPVDTVRVQNDIWLGANSTKIMEGEALPSWVEKEDGITIAISEDAMLPDIIQEISDMTGITIRLDDLKAEDAIPEDAVPVKYSGKLSGLLNYLSNRYGLYWQYKDDTIIFFTQETRVFTVYALPTDSDFSANMTGATMAEGGGGNATSTLSVKTDLKIWDNIEEGVKQVVGENGKLSFSRVAGTVTVTASPYIVRKVAEYIAGWNEKLSRQVAVTVRLMAVKLKNTDNYGLNLNAIFQGSRISSSFGSSFAAVEGLTGGGSLSMTLLKPGKWSGTQAVVDALSTQGKTRLVTSASVTTLNNKVAPVNVSTSQNYVKEVTVTKTIDDGNTSTDVDFDVQTLNYGFTMEVLPRILDHGRLILLFNLSYTDLVSMESATGGDAEGGQVNPDSDSETESEAKTIKLPTMQMRGFVQEIAMRSGQTLVLTGFEQEKEQAISQGIGKAQMGLLGGNAYNTSDREVLVITITPEVLESPLSPEALMRNY